MTTSRDYRRKSLTTSAIVLALAIGGLICVGYYVGFRYETKKLSALLTTLTLVFIYEHYIGDVILMFLKATFYAIKLRYPWTGDVNPIFVGGPDRKEYLRRRISALKSQLALGPSFYKRNEAMTHKYKEVLTDLILFGGYLSVLFVLIIGTRDPLAYYNTRTIKDVLRNPKLSHSAINNIFSLDDLYNFINGTIVEGFNDGRSYNGKPFNESGWMDLQLAKVLGVIRLRQIRHTSLSGESSFDTKSYGPGWVDHKKISSVQYMDKFWRISQPWEYQTSSQTGSDVMAGSLYRLPGSGYVALLGRNLVNSRRVLEFLRKNNWIDSYTAVIIIEFTLYNVDADLFTLVRILVEQTAFNSFFVLDKIETLKLLFNIDNLPWYALLTFLFYFIILMRVVAYVVVKMWYSNSFGEYFASSWNFVDVAIVALNICIAFGIWMREMHVKSLILQLETSRRNEFVSFHHAASIDESCTVLIAFLVTLTTLRLWKILQFARVFRVLTSTLHHAKRPLASTTFFIGIFIASIGLGSFIINGSNSPSFANFIKSVTTLLSLSFGFHTNATPSDLSHGGNALGYLLYMVLLVVVTIFLINMFVTVLCLHFDKEKEDDKERSANQDDYSFWDFLQDEIAESSWVNFFKGKKKLVKTEDDDVLRLRGGGGRLTKSKKNSSNAFDRTERLELVAEILTAQMELLQLSLDTEDQDEDIQSDEEVGASMSSHVEENSKPDSDSKTSKKFNIPIEKKKGKTCVGEAKSRTTLIRSV